MKRFLFPIVLLLLFRFNLIAQETWTLTSSIPQFDKSINDIHLFNKDTAIAVSGLDAMTTYDGGKTWHRKIVFKPSGGFNILSSVFFCR